MCEAGHACSGGKVGVGPFIFVENGFEEVRVKFVEEKRDMEMTNARVLVIESLYRCLLVGGA